MHAFVTGANGLLGGNLVRLLAQQGHQVTALVRSKQRAATTLVGLDVRFVEGDLRDIGGYAAALDGCDTLFHTAAYFREYFAPGDHWSVLKAINVDATIALLEEAERRGVRRAVHTSSTGVIGHRKGSDASDESDGPDDSAMANLYFRSKVVAEDAVRAFLARSALPVTMVLPGWMWGPGDAAPTGSGQITLDFLNRRLPGVFPGGGCPVDARDVAQGMLAAAERGRSGERYIVGGDTYISMAAIFRTLEDVSGVPGPRLPVPAPAALFYGWMSDQYSRITGRPTTASVAGVRTLLEMHRTSSAKAVRELGVTFRPFKETLRDEVAWFRANTPERLSAPGAARQAAG
jgi:dihydroflavonol-4-reductase